jgi:hypothetical protein
MRSKLLGDGYRNDHGDDHSETTAGELVPWSTAVSSGLASRIRSAPCSGPEERFLPLRIHQCGLRRHRVEQADDRRHRLDPGVTRRAETGSW